MNIYEIKKLSFSYDNNRYIFKNANLTIEEGKIYSLLGKNGAGKSTLFSLLLNLKSNYTGDILFMNENIKSIDRKRLAKKIGYVPQIPKLSFDYTAREYVAMGLLSETTVFSNLNKRHFELVEIAFKKLDIFSIGIL